MCGIAGILPSTPTDPVELERLVRRMNDTLVNRGPDDSGYFVRPNIALAMRRLAIIDVAGGQQPMHSTNERMTIVFNGEIYNYRTVRADLKRRGCHFYTQCDTEVVLRAFETSGLEGIKSLEGMFAFAIWNNATRELTLARDWMGQKSLFLARTSLGFAFASEIKALLTLPDIQAQIDVTALSHYMSLRYLPDRSTLFDGIEKLPPAHALVLRDGQKTFVEMWRPSYEPKSRCNDPSKQLELGEPAPPRRAMEGIAPVLLNRKDVEPANAPIGADADLEIQGREPFIVSQQID